LESKKRMMRRWRNHQRELRSPTLVADVVGSLVLVYL
jgi:hypothetical protein